MARVRSPGSERDVAPVDVRHRAVQELAAHLSAAVTPQEVLDIVADRVGPLLGAHMVNISVLNPAGDTLSLVIMRQTSKGVEERFATYPVDAPLPSRDALLTGRPVLIRSLAERHERYPLLAGENADHQAFAVLPLLTGGRALGVLALGWLVEQDYSATTVVTAEEIAALCAAALDRAERYREERDARAAAEAVTHRLRELQALTRELAQATEPAVVADLIVSTASRALHAEAAVIGDVDGSGTFHILAARGLPLEWLERWRRFTADDAPLLGDLLKDRTPVVVNSPDPCDPSDVTSLALAPRAWVHLPLVSGDSVLGFAFFGRIQPGELSDEDVDFATAVASHAAIALDRANLLGESRGAAETLQRALLPQIISGLPGWNLAGRYIPAVEGTQVGGDWYDAFALSNGAVGLVLGDVAGKGIRAAAVMGAVRSALRAFAILDPTPSVVLAELDLYIATFKPKGTMVTCCYAVLDPDSGQVTYASAGHPPALLIGPGGNAWLDRATTPPLGFGSGVTRRQSTAKVGARSVLLMYSDGLIERRRHPLSEGLCDLARAADRLPGAADLQAAVDDLVDGLNHPDRTIDDLAVLAVRRTAPIGVARAGPLTRPEGANIDCRPGLSRIG